MLGKITTAVNFLSESLKAVAWELCRGNDIQERRDEIVDLLVLSGVESGTRCAVEINSVAGVIEGLTYREIQLSGGGVVRTSATFNEIMTKLEEHHLKVAE